VVVQLCVEAVHEVFQPLNHALHTGLGERVMILDVVHEFGQTPIGIRLDVHEHLLVKRRNITPQNPLDSFSSVWLDRYQ
jgi:hypothetical protein